MKRAWARHAGFAQAALLLGCLLPGAGTANAQDAQLAKVLAQLDAAAAKFTTASADFTWDQLTAVVGEHDVQTGTIAFRRGAKGTAMVVHVLTEDGQSRKRDVLFQGGVLDLYQPEIHQETTVHAGKNQGQFESYATLGFGGSGRDLQANWNVAYSGAETIDGTPVAHLQLTPKQTAPDQMFSRIEIWIDPATATSRKQVFYAASGDSRTALYKNVVENKTPDGAFKLKIPGDTHVVQK